MSQVLPWAQFAIAAVPVVFAVLWVEGRLPTARLWAVIVIGSLFPDLIDKHLAHLLFILPSGRVGAHSLPFAIPIALVALAVAWKLN